MNDLSPVARPEPRKVAVVTVQVNGYLSGYCLAVHDFRRSETPIDTELPIHDECATRTAETMA